MKPIFVENAVGKKLAYDVSIITEDFKGALFRKGHVIRSEDVRILKKAGHYYVFVEEESFEDLIFEDDAVRIFAEYISGKSVYVENVAEGKAFIRAKNNGLFKVNEIGLYKVNFDGTFAVITIKNNTGVRKDSLLAIVDLIPLTISKEYFEKLKELVKPYLPLIEVKAFKKKTVGLIVTGTEIYKGLIEDLATDKVKAKVKEYGGILVERVIVPDDEEIIRRKILEFSRKYDIVILTGGMSVDPTDKTPRAIASTGAKIITYGLPIKPTTMTMLAYLNSKPIIGVSSGIIFFKEQNALDILLPKIMADEKWCKEEIARLGCGGIMDSFLKKKAKFSNK